MTRLAIIVGHNAEKRGATKRHGRDAGAREYDWNSVLAGMIEARAEALGIDARSFYHAPGKGYLAEIKETYREADAWGADLAVELHFNAFGDPAACGTEVLCRRSSRSAILARHVQAQMIALLGTRDRGVRDRAPEDRGGGALYAGRAPAILIEPFFGSSPEDCAAMDRAGREALAGAIVAGIGRALLEWPRPDLAGSRTITAAQRDDHLHRSAV